MNRKAPFLIAFGSMHRTNAVRFWQGTSGIKNTLFPHTLNRTQYGLHGLVVLTILIAGTMLWVAALVTFWVFLLWTIAIWIYGAIGLAAPRLRDAGHPTSFALVALVPVVIVLLFLPSKKQQIPKIATRPPIDSAKVDKEQMGGFQNCVVVISVPESKAHLRRALQYRMQNKTCFKGIKARLARPPIGTTIHVADVWCSSPKPDRHTAKLMARQLQEYLDSFVEQLSKNK